MTRTERILAAMVLVAGTATAEHYRFRNYGPDEGLNTAVSRLLQDRTGFLWVGTGDGLFRYDGARFQRFGTDDGLPSASIRSLLETADGTLWVVTGRGIGRRRGNSFEIVDNGLGNDATDFHALDAAPDGTLYLGYDRGLLSATAPKDGAPPHFYPVAGVPREPVNGIYAESSGAVWFGCGLRLGLLEHGKLRFLDEHDGVPPDRWGAMLRDRGGALWIRGPQHMSVLAAGAQRFEARDSGLPQSSNTILTLAEDRQGIMMVSTDQGLARWIGSRWDLIGTAQGLESETVTTVLEDREGSIWIGLWGAGLARWPGNREWTNWTAEDGLSNNIVWAIRRDAAGDLWLGTDRGLVRFNSAMEPKTWFKNDGLGGDKVKALAIGSDGAVWAGSLPGGVSRIDPRTGHIRTFGAASGLADDRVIALHFDREDRLWVSTGEGLFRSTSSGPDLHFQRQIPPGSQERTMFFRFLGDRQGRVWVSSGQGLFRWEAGNWTRFSTADGLKSNGVTHVGEAEDGSIWIAYREPVGLSRITFSSGATRVQHFSKKDGLPSDYALFLGRDSRGQMWVGTDYGAAVLAGDRWIVYTHEDGLVWDDCAANAFLAEPDGTVWIGTLKGLSRFRPGDRLSPLPVPPPVITGAKFGGHAANLEVTSEVAFRERDFLVSFSGLTFLSEKNVRFRYRLVGLDRDWIETALREARYSSLPANDYTFQVEARNAGGPWSPSPATLSFRVAPTWWQTWWFRAIAAAAMVNLLGLILRARILQISRDRERLKIAVGERTRELELQKDVVERQKHEIENLLRQAEEVSRLKSEFLANMSHEIRTPMNGVIGMTQLALGTALSEEQREYITTVQSSAEALLVVINDILDFSKIEAGKLELAHDLFGLRQCISDALSVFAWKAHYQGLKLTQEIDAGVPETLVGDSGRLRQILLNLLSNAMKFTEGGQISLSVLPVPCEDDSKIALCFAVRDTGMGIPADKQAFIFEAFAQADGSVRRRRRGTGLGLAISSKLVQLMNGRIWVESTEGVGSTFSFTAMFAKAEPTVGVSALAEHVSKSAGETFSGRLPKASRPLRILLAEDNTVNQRVAKLMIEKMGHSIVLVENGRLAVEAYSQQQFDAILMDLQMPEMDGFEATARIREAEKLTAGGHAPHIPIIALTAHAMRGDPDECLRAGMDDYISKPISIKALIAALEKVQAELCELPQQ
jgi:signal transduction histidine kinase/ligand-binding sensor domain-containing protein/ActR/RegA family two-component response regulator